MFRWAGKSVSAERAEATAQAYLRDEELNGFLAASPEETSARPGDRSRRRSLKSNSRPARLRVGESVSDVASADGIADDAHK